MSATAVVLLTGVHHVTNNVRYEPLYTSLHPSELAGLAAVQQINVLS